MRLWPLILRIAAYALYAVVVFVVFLYVTFPYDVLQQRLVELVAREGGQLTLERLQPAFPPGLQARRVRLVAEQGQEGEAALQIETLRVQPEWLPLLSGKLQVRFEGGLYGGRLEGEVRQAQGAGEAVWDVKTRFADLDIAQYPLIRKAEKPFLRGRLSGEVALMLNAEGHMQDGTFTLHGQPVVLSGIPGGLLQLQREIACDTLMSELKTMPSQEGNIVLTCQGKDLAIEARGTIGWKAPMAESQVNLRWQVRSDETYRSEMALLSVLVRKRPDRRGELSFRMQGPLRQVRVGA